MTAATSAICGFFCLRLFAVFGGDADGSTGAEEDVVGLEGLTTCGWAGSVAAKSCSAIEGNHKI